MTIFIVVPAYNESGRISRALLRLREALQDTADRTYKMVIIDDGSLDTTYQEAVTAQVGSVLRFVINRGQGAALRAGNEYAIRHGADIIVHFDADDQHEPADILSLIQPLINQECDVVMGSRFMKNAEETPSVRTIIHNILTKENVPLLRRILGVGSWVVNTVLLSGLVLTDIHNGLRAFTRDVALQFDLRQDRMAHASEYQNEVHRLKLTYKEVPMTVHYGHNDKQSQNVFDGLKILKESLWAKVIK